jgi:uncharacterized protein (DUF433 family)
MESRIMTDPAILGGKPCIRGTRLSVEFILELIASGATTQDIVKAYPHLIQDDVAAAVQFAADYLRGSSQLEVEIAR